MFESNKSSKASQCRPREAQNAVCNATHSTFTSFPLRSSHRLLFLSGPSARLFLVSLFSLSLSLHTSIAISVSRFLVYFFYFIFLFFFSLLLLLFYSSLFLSILPPMNSKVCTSKRHDT